MVFYPFNLPTSNLSFANVYIFYKKDVAIEIIFLFPQLLRLNLDNILNAGFRDIYVYILTGTDI